MWRDCPIVVAVVAVGASIASFIALIGSSRTGWGIFALYRASEVLVFLAIAAALAVERRSTRGAWQGQIATAAVAIAFATVALVKFYSGSGSDVFPNMFARADEWVAEAAILALGALALGLIGRRVATSLVWVSCVTAAFVAVGCAIYAISLKGSSNADIWYEVALTAAALAGSAAARMHRR